MRSQPEEVLTMKADVLWGSFRIAISVLNASLAASAVLSQSIYTHFREPASWFVLLAVFNQSIEMAMTHSFSLPINSTIACTVFAFYLDVERALSLLAARCRVTVHLTEKAYSSDSEVTKLFPIVRLP
ncbi:hypothetical protein D0866_03666 [Hortaea werneckii]|uniref:Uncharacterized protein n=1 Tax=Hortaea werneckii TaxID=91943 RepID=A0A3M7BAF8_HORWE|nr:hypothetical protein D0866_03666 [Hortaea werneckii]